MTNDEKWTALQIGQALASGSLKRHQTRRQLDGAPSLYSPESYSLEEKRGICNDMIITSKVVLDAMRGRPPTAPSALGRHNPSEHPFGQFSCPFSSDKP